MSADKYVSISILIPLAKTLLHFTTGTGASTTVCTEPLTQLRRRFGSMESNHFLVVSTLLDPHMKKIAFRDPTAAQQGVDWIIQEMTSVSAATSTIASVVPLSTASSTGSNSSFNLWEMFNARVAESESRRGGSV